MFNAKNISSRNIAFLGALCIGLCSAGLLFLFTLTLWQALLTFFVIGILSFFVIYVLIEKFIYRNIKLIYKFISKEKVAFKEKRLYESTLSKKTLGEVQKDVENWAKEKGFEITALEGNEAFRKEFLMNLAHELRTPIFAIQGYISTLLDGELNNPEVNIKFLERASKSADRLNDLVEDVDKISKYESNSLSIEKSSFSIQELIKEVFDELMPKSKLNKISTVIKRGCEGNIFIYADRGKIKQVLINLIENAIKYGKEKGSVLAGIYLVDNDYVLVEIADNGIGIEEDKVARVFERFFRTDAARAVDNRGNGLGLAIAKHIIEAHGENITCRSTIGQGTTFGFTMPKSLD